MYYEQKDYGKAIKNYEKAMRSESRRGLLLQQSGRGIFRQEAVRKGGLNYSKAMELDPDVFERISRAGVQAQLPSPDDRARYDYVLAKLYARMGVADRSLRYLQEGDGGRLQGYWRTSTKTMSSANCARILALRN